MKCYPPGVTQGSFDFSWFQPSTALAGTSSGQQFAVLIVSGQQRRQLRIVLDNWSDASRGCYETQRSSHVGESETTELEYRGTPYSKVVKSEPD